MKTKYVLGFVFSENKQNVVLIKKEKPVWQKGFLNGIGGKIENNESPIQSMVREFKEETGFQTTETKWVPFCEMEGLDFIVYCFKLFCNNAFTQSKTSEIESILKVKTNEIINYHCISNLNWLIQLALDDNDNKNFYAYVKY